jgi:integrase
MALTVKRIAKLINAGERGRYFDGAGLYLVIGGENSANWSRRYGLDHKAHWMGLGSARVFTLDEVRERNREVSKLLADNIDPLQKKRSAAAAMAAEAIRGRTFEECARDYIERHQDEWKSSQHAKQWTVSLEKFVFPKIGQLPIAAIDKALVLNVLEQPIVGDNRHPASGKFWQARTTTADRVRNRIELVLSFAMQAGYRPDGPNPAAWAGLKEILAAPTKINGKKHHAALPYAELPAFLSSLRQHEGVGARALEFTILTVARLGEVVGAQWNEVDLGTGLWTIPANRMKGGKEHRVPLSPAAIALLKALPTERGNPNLFVGARGDRTSQAAVTVLPKRLGFDVTVHGFRSTFSDFAHERTAFSNHVIELSLAHAIGNEVEKAYRRGDLLDKRRKLMEAWAAFAATPATAGAVPMRRA